ncbi:MAG: NAD-dependent epimerase/dehydratase family protein [Verrucomicrobiota bacterium]|nr:NAD-dependent epimerase/dehydratase family protein [Verrucomicrobiota bacterium]
MKVLYIGGTGQISFDCVHETVNAGHDTWVFNRGNNNEGLPDKVSFIVGDFFDYTAYSKLADMQFDVVCQFRVFTPEQLQRDLDLFSGKIKQYLFISSASAYKKPTPHYIITEEIPLDNPFAEYSSNKAACELLLKNQSALPYTIVRPSHTSRTKFTTAMGEGKLAAQRMLRNKAIVVPGDGTSLWTITASADFAPPFVKLIGNSAALNDYFHLTSDNAYAWNWIYLAIGKALGVTPELVHVPSDTLARYNPDWIGALLGDKAYSVIFDNSKIKKVVGDFYCNTSLDSFMSDLVEKFVISAEDKETPDSKLDSLFDQIILDQKSLGNS